MIRSNVPRTWDDVPSLIVVRLLRRLRAECYTVHRILFLLWAT